MEKQYFIFGQGIVREYFDNGIEGAIKFVKGGGEHNLYVWDQNAPNDLLEAYDGWDGYAEVSSDTFNQLVAASL